MNANTRSRFHYKASYQNSLLCKHVSRSISTIDWVRLWLGYCMMRGSSSFQSFIPIHNLWAKQIMGESRTSISVSTWIISWYMRSIQIHLEPIPPLIVLGLDWTVLNQTGVGCWGQPSVNGNKEMRRKGRSTRINSAPSLLVAEPRTNGDTEFISPIGLDWPGLDFLRHPTSNFQLSTFTSFQQAVTAWMINTTHRLQLQTKSYSTAFR